jgi:tetratricopeptide (TPR) repeat protein
MTAWTAARLALVALGLAGAWPAPAPAQSAAAQPWLARGKQAFERGDYRAAVDAFSAAAQADADFAGAHYGLCISHLRLEEARRALDDCTRAIRLDPRHAQAHYIRGLVLAERLGNNQAALADFDRAIGLEPRYAAAYFKRANARARLNDLAGARLDYDAVIRLAPDGDAHFNRGVVRFKLGDRAGAVDDLRLAARLFREQGDQAGYDRAIAGLRQVEAER